MLNPHAVRLAMALAALATLAVSLPLGASAGGPVPVTSAAATASPLRGTTWRLVELDGAAVRSSAPGRGPPVPTLRLDPDVPRAAAHSGCNAMSAPFTLDGASLRIGPVIGSSMACERGMEREAAFGQMLEKVAGFAIEGRRLQLRGAGGAVLARFEAAP